MRTAKSTTSRAVISLSFLLAFTLLLAVVPASAAGSTSLIISQYYSQGGKSTSAFMTDYVELYNNGTSEIDLTTGNWTIQFQNGAGTGGGATGFATNTSYYLGGPTFTYYTRPSDSATNGFNGHLKPGQFLLIQIPGTNSGGGLARLENTIVPDIAINTSTLTVAGTANSSLWTTTTGTTISQAGQIALANSTTPVTCTAANPTNSVDFVGWGTAVCYEGSAAAGVLANNGRYLRAYWRGGASGSSTGAQTGSGSNICTDQFDTDVNSSDFQAVAIGTNANTYDTKFQLHSSAKVLTISSSGAYNTPVPYNPILCGTATATPNPVSQGGEFTVSVAVKGTDISAAPYTVTADLSGITGGGLSNATPLNGSGATLTSDTQTILASVAQAPYTLTFTGHDNNGETIIIPSIKLTVGPKPDVDIQCNGGRDTQFTKAKSFTNAVYATGTTNSVSCTMTTPPTYTVQKRDGSEPSYVTVGSTPYLAVDSYRVVCSNAVSSDCNIVNYPIKEGTMAVDNNYFAITPLGGSVSMKCGSSGTATYTGSPIACTLSFSPSVTDVSPAIPFSCDPITYIGINGTVYPASTTPPTNQGSYTVTELGNCYSSDPNYTMSLPADSTLTINQGTPNVNVKCNSVTFTGAPQACVPGASASVDKAGTIPISGGTFSALTYTGITDPTYGPTTNPPTNPGDYTVAAVFTPADTINWASGATGSGTMTILNAESKPVADPQSVSVAVYSANNPITLTASNTPTSFTAGAASNGTVSCTGAACTYTPNNGYLGSDSFTFTATNAGGTSDPATVSISVIAPVAATLTAPTTGTVLSGKTATFTWTAGTLVSKYMLFVGTTAGGADDFYSGEVTSTTLDVNGLRSADGKVYVRLYSWIPSLKGWRFNDYVFNYGGPEKATLTSPLGSVSGRSATFTWTTGTDVTKYMLFVGTAPGVPDNFYSGEVTTTSLLVNGLRSTDGNIYVRLYSWYENGWHFNDYVLSYTPPVTPVGATLTAPVAISGTTAEFTWTAGTAIDHYMLCVGTQAGGTDNYYSGPTTSTDIVVNGLRTIDGNVYVRLYSWATDHWLWHDYVVPVQ